MTKFQDIRTIDELREFAGKSQHFAVMPDSDEVKAVHGALSFNFMTDGNLDWNYGGLFGFPLFDDRQEAERAAMEQRHERLSRELAECEKRLGKPSREAVLKGLAMKLSSCAAMIAQIRFFLTRYPQAEGWIARCDEMLAMTVKADDVQVDTGQGG